MYNVQIKWLTVACFELRFGDTTIVKMDVPVVFGRAIDAVAAAVERESPAQSCASARPAAAQP